MTENAILHLFLLSRDINNIMHFQTDIFSVEEHNKNEHFKTKKMPKLNVYDSFSFHVFQWAN